MKDARTPGVPAPGATDTGNGTTTTTQYTPSAAPAQNQSGTAGLPVPPAGPAEVTAAPGAAVEAAVQAAAGTAQGSAARNGAAAGHGRAQLTLARVMQAIDAYPAGKMPSPAAWQAILALIAAAAPDPTGTDRAELLAAVAQRYGAPLSDVAAGVEKAQAEMAQDGALPLEARIATLPKDAPATEVEALCAELAALPSDLQRASLVKLLAQRTGYGLQELKRAIAQAAETVKQQGGAVEAEAVGKKGRRLAEMFPSFLFPGPKEYVLSARYRVDPDGRVWEDSERGSEEVCPQLVVPVARLIDLDTKNVQYRCAVLHFEKKEDGTLDLTKPYWEYITANADEFFDARRIVTLSTQGLPVDSKHGRSTSALVFEHAILNETCIPTICTTTTLGWRDRDGQRLFVLPDAVIGGEGSLPTATGSAGTAGANTATLRVVPPDAGDQQLLGHFATKGTWAGWCKLLLYVAGEAPLARLAVYVALASPLLAILRQQGALVHMCGKTSSGKSTILQVAASAVGKPGGPGLGPGLVRDWEGTYVANERRFGLLSHVPAFLDDSQNAPDETVARTVQLLANGTGRSRGSVKGTAVMRTWQLMCLSTGEKTVRETSAYGGIQVRSIDLWLARPPFSGGAACNQARAMADQHYGHALPRFVAAVLQHDEQELLDRHQDATQRLVEALSDVPEAGAEMVSRLAGVWAAVYLAAALAHADVLADVYPQTSDDLFGFVVGWFRRTVNTEGPRHSHLRAAEDMWSWIASNNAAFYGSPAAETAGRAPIGGWLGRYTTTVAGQSCVAVVGTALRDWLRHQGYPPEATVRALADAGMMLQSADGRRPDHPVTIGAGGSRSVARCYVLPWAGAPTAPAEPTATARQGAQHQAKQPGTLRAPYCYQCGAHLLSVTHPTCPTCGWLRCSCGACSPGCPESAESDASSGAGSGADNAQDDGEERF